MMSINVKSTAFWSAIGGAASTVCGAVGAGSLGSPIRALLIAVGGLLIAIPAHHVTGKQQGTLPKASPNPQ